MRVCLAALACLGAGCFGPDLPEGFSCARSGECPEGQHCDRDRRCRFAPQSSADAAADAPGGAALCSDSSLLLCLRFEGNLADESRSPTEVAVGGSPEFVEGRDGAALHTASGYVTAADFASGNLREATIDLWLLADEVEARQPIVASSGEVQLHLEGGFLELAAGSSNISVGPIEPGRWYHVAVIASVDRAAFYLDGREVATAPGASLGVAPEASLGSDFGSGQLRARIDTVRLRERVLSSQEIAEIVAR